jgi:hypothetical protein
MLYPLLQAYGRSGWGILQYSILIIFVLGLVAFMQGLKMLKETLGHWHHRFDNIPFSSQEFYTTLEETLSRRGVEGIETSRTTYAQGGILSPSREYLRIRYNEFVYDVCAAPFAKGYFVSWWMGELGSPLRDFFRNLPFIGKLFNRRAKTFYELDTEIMFKETISLCVKEAIDTLTESKGVRKLMDTDWQESRLHH